DALREAARQALESLGDGGGEGEVARVTLDVLIDGRAELVTVALRDGKLAWTTSGEGPHVRAALRWLAGRAEPRVVRTAESGEGAAPRVSWVPEAMDAEQ